MNDTVRERAVELLAAINLGPGDVQGVKALYRKGIRIACPCYPDGGLELEITFTNDQVSHIDTFLDRNGFAYSCSCGLARVVSFRDTDEYRSFFDKLAMLFAIGNLMSGTHRDR